MNPNSLTKEKLGIYKDCGINRFSLGVQSFSDAELQAAGRSHTASDARSTVALLDGMGIDNFNLDLMFSLPLQTPESWISTLKEACESGAAHISAYSLTLEEHTPLYAGYAAGKYAQDDGLDREMYHAAAELLAQANFTRYEISNYAKAGHACRHNLYCWDMQPYIGLGAAAHSYAGAKRFHNAAALDAYLSEADHLAAYRRAVPESEEERMGDFVMLALRKVSGVDLKAFQKLFGVDFESRYACQIEKWTRQGMFFCHDGRYALTERGLDFASAVMRDFIL
jgi:oxygen-independent coproporphyrinogen-3 oxidase